LNRHEPGTRNWINSQSGLDSITCEALLAEETRPRCLTTPDSILLILRGVNLNPGSDPEDMVSIRAWADANRVITLRGQRLLAIQDIRDRLSAGPGFATPGDLLATLAARLIDRMGPVVDALQDEFDGLEEDLLGAEEKEARPRLSAIRRQAVALRRYLSPQRDVLSRLSTETLPWLTEANRARFRETADRVTRYVEDLDATRERASVTQEELTARLQDRMNRNMYILSLVAAVFLPLGLITGLLGINVGGIPGTDSPGAFIVVCVILGVIGILELLLFYFRRWL
jgi:zinc transporter